LSWEAEDVGHCHGIKETHIEERHRGKISALGTPLFPARCQWVRSRSNLLSYIVGIWESELERENRQ
jgi:hypothetical protein